MNWGVGEKNSSTSMPAGGNPAHGVLNLLFGCHLVEHLEQQGRVNRIETLSWGRGYKRSIDMHGVTISAFEVEHWAKRASNKYRGYNGYVIASNKGPRVAFFGDTAFRPPKAGVWKKRLKIDQGENRLDVCLLPIGTFNYQPHIGPYKAWKIYKEVCRGYLTPLHYRTFVDEPPPEVWADDRDWLSWRDEPLCALGAFAGPERDKIVCADIGAECSIEKGSLSVQRMPGGFWNDTCGLYKKRGHQRRLNPWGKW